MAHKTEWLSFFIVLKDPKEVKRQQELHPHGVVMAPNDAAELYEAPFKGYDEPTGGAPYSWTPWSGLNTKGGVYPLDVEQFERKSGGWWVFGGTTTTFIWLIQFKLVTTPVDPDADGPISVRRWVEGFELGAMAPFSGTSGNLIVSRDASRHVGGFGLACRGASSQALTISLNRYGYDPALVVGNMANGKHSWERFYFRLRRRPTSSNPAVWRCSGSPSAGAGIVFVVTPNADMTVWANDAVGVGTLLGTAFHMTEWDPVSNPNAWHRVDLLIKYDNSAGGPDARFAVWLDGFPIYDSGTNCPGLNQTSQHASSSFGSTLAVTNDCEIDFDDWTCQDIPYTINGTTGNRDETLNVQDFVNGRKIVGLHASGYSANHNAAGWPGDFRILDQLPLSTSANVATLGSSTSGALAAVNVDDADLIDNDKGKIGTGAIVVWMYGTRGTTSGQVGLDANGTTTMVSGTQLASPSAIGMLKSPPGNVSTFPDLTPIELRHSKGADVGAATLAVIAAQVELIGAWGKEDQPYPNTVEDQEALEAVDFGTPIGQHNAPYPHSPWSQPATVAPISPFIVKAGTYVGNGTGQDLAFRAPVNWLFIRRASGGAGTLTWWSTMYSSHLNFQEGAASRMPIGMEDLSFTGTVDEDQQQRYILRVAGADAGSNVLGATYEYIAVCDPGMRFALNFGATHRAAEGTVDNKLVNPDFLADFAFCFLETFSSTTTNHLFGKGPGNAIDTVAGFGGQVAFTSGFEIATGVIRSKSTINGVAQPAAYSLWRKDDGNELGGAKALQIVTWTGDGNASRTIGLTVSGLRPVFAMVFGEGLNSFFRDPSHTGTNSGNSAGTDTANGITGGMIDGFTIGSSLNGNGVIFNAWVLMGSATAGNNGWSVNGEFANVDYYSPEDGPWGDPPDEDDPSLDPDTTPVSDADANPFVTDEPDLDDTLDLPGTTHVCVYFTQRIVNEALGLIGVSKQVTDLRLETTIEANVARVNMRYDVETTLRDYAWPFATTYKRLALVAGSVVSPVNADWTYSYRRPWDCVFERRLVVARGTSVDPTPPPFAIGSDTGGGLLYCNVANVTLEYTGRKQCPTYEGDVLFRDALTWRVAMRLAPALSRIEGKAQAALQGYELALQKARLILTPGKPGSGSVTMAYDTTAAQIAANVAVVNRALVRIGARTISSFNEQSKEADAARVIFEDELRSTLRDFPWPFATAYASPLTLVAGTTTVGANGDWTYSYRLPTDLVYARRLVTASKRAFDENPPPFKIATDGTGELLYTNQVSAVLEYTTRAAGAVAIADPLFRDAFAWRLAASLAPSLADADPQVPEQVGRGPDDPAQPKDRRATRTQIRRQAGERAWQMYQLALRTARVAAANEQQRDQTPPDAPWITGR